MTIAEKVTKSSDLLRFTLFKKGLFYKCYNEDAMVFVQRIKNYKITAKFVKSVGTEVLRLGFPASEVEKGNLSLEVIKSAINATSYKKITDCVVYHIPDNIKANYQKYQEALVNSKNMLLQKNN